MKLRDHLAAARRKRKGPLCTVCQLMTTLDDDNREALEEAFASTMTSTAISDALREEQIRILPTTIARHRRGDCLREHP